MADPTSTPATIGELSVSTLLSTLNLVLDPQTYVFLTLPPSTTPPATLDYKMLFKESEGMTAIATQSSAIQHNLESTFPCRCITLNVHSSLEAVGFIAKIGERLTKLGIGVNPVSGYFHDHIFVPVGREQEVISALEELRDEARKQSLGEGE